ncbi:unnamed protein product, partial [marine sediment metagenome]
VKNTGVRLFINLTPLAPLSFKGEKRIVIKGAESL